MFSFLPQFLIIASLLGIIVIVLRKVPGIGELMARTPLTRLPARFWEVWGLKLKDWLLGAAKKFWRFVLEVKEIPHHPGWSRQNLLEKFRQARFHLPKARLPFLRNPDSPDFFLKEAQKSLEREDYADAERKYIKVIEKDAKNEAAFAGLGKLYLAQKKYEEAAETYKFLVKSFPKSDSYLANLGQAYHGQKLYDSAVEAYEQAIELNPENGKRYVNLGLTLEAKKHLAEAILNYRKALSLEKDNPQFLMVLAEALVKRGDKEEAEVILEQILQLEPTNHLAREKLMQLKF